MAMGGVEFSKDGFPVFHLILRILADYLDEPPPAITGEPIGHPVYNALFDLWRSPDADALIPILLAACDEHTYRCDDGYEFGDFIWERTPIEILLVFKLRQLIGLQNPTLDHPLMNTTLGVLPEEVVFEPDDLVKRVRERMMSDGYDEDEIAATTLAA